MEYRMSTTRFRPAASAEENSLPASPRVRDTRSFWRLLLAFVAPIPMAFMGVVYLIRPVEGGAAFTDTVAGVEAHRQLFDLMMWLGLPFLVGLIPAVIAVAWVTRRRTPVLTTVGAVWTLLGCLSVFPLGVPDDVLAYLAVREGLDVATIAALDAAWWVLPPVGGAALLFISGIVVGLPLLGIALWRSRVAPRWMAIALIVGGVTHPFLPNHVIAGVGLLIAAVGFAGATVALLRMPNDEFDLPPVAMSEAAR
jgi:hypothetical protein